MYILCNADPPPEGDFKLPPCPSPELILPQSHEVLDDQMVNIPESALHIGKFASDYDVYTFNGAIERCGVPSALHSLSASQSTTTCAVGSGSLSMPCKQATAGAVGTCIAIAEAIPAQNS